MDCRSRNFVESDTDAIHSHTTEIPATMHWCKKSGSITKTKTTINFARPIQIPKMTEQKNAWLYLGEFYLVSSSTRTHDHNQRKLIQFQGLNRKAFHHQHANLHSHYHLYIYSKASC